MIKHIVMWKLKEKDKEQNAKEIKARLEELKSVIPQIQFLEVSRNFNKSNMAFDLILYSEFNTVDDLEIYQNHPAHKEAGAFVAQVVTERAVGDYKTT